MKTTFRLIVLLGFYLAQICQSNNNQERAKTWSCCDNVKTAIDCYLVNHCIVDHWSKISRFSKLELYMCKDCITMVELTREKMTTNITRADLKVYVDRLCHAYFAGVESYAPVCHELIHDIFDEFEMMLQSQMVPELICQMAEICPNRYKYSSACLMCMQYSDELFSELSMTSGTESFEHLGLLLHKYCDVLTLKSHVCDVMLKKSYNVEVYMKLLLMLKNYELCNLSPYCFMNSFAQMAEHSDELAIKIHEDQSGSCQFCQVVANSIRFILTRFNGFEQYKAFVESVCQNFFETNMCNVLLDDKKIASRLFLMLKEKNLGANICMETYQCFVPIENNDFVKSREHITAENMMENFPNISLPPQRPNGFFVNESHYLRNLRLQFEAENPMFAIERADAVSIETILAIDLHVHSSDPKMYVHVYQDCLYLRYLMVEMNITRIKYFRAVCPFFRTKLIGFECATIMPDLRLSDSKIELYRKKLISLAEKCVLEINITSVRIADKECVMCLFLSQLIEDFLSRDEDVDMLEPFLIQACHTLIGKTRDNCLAFVRHDVLRIAFEYYSCQFAVNLCQRFAHCE